MKGRYNPDFVVKPGETIKESLEALGMTRTELAKRMGLPKKTINEIISAKAEITPETAIQLERVFGVPADFWINLEIGYRNGLARRKEKTDQKRIKRKF
jgi:addiction module HigA family antidote